MFFFLFTISLMKYFFLLNAARNVNKNLYVTNGGVWGDWGETEFCPDGTYAIGYDMKIESSLGKGRDDTSLNAVRLICADVDGNRLGGTITSTVSKYGDWVGETVCQRIGSSPSFVSSFALQVEPKQIFGDDTAANYMKTKCRDYTGGTSVPTVKPPGHGHFGDWGPWSESCPLYSAVCGIQTRVERHKIGIDDTALNDVHLYCCTEGRAASDPFG